MLIRHEHVVRSPTICASGMRWGVRKIVVIVSGCATGTEKATERVRKPQRAKNIVRSLTTMIVGFCIKKRNSRRQAVVSPNLHDVSNQLRFLVQIPPRSLASIVGIMFKGHE